MKRRISRLLAMVFEDTSKLSVEERLDNLEMLHRSLFFLQIVSSIFLIKLFLEIA